MFVTSSSSRSPPPWDAATIPGSPVSDREESPAEADDRRRVAKITDERLADKNPTDDRNGAPRSGTVSIRTNDNVPISDPLPFASYRIDHRRKRTSGVYRAEVGSTRHTVGYRRCRKAAVASERYMGGPAMKDSPLPGSPSNGACLEGMIRCRFRGSQRCGDLLERAQGDRARSGHSHTPIFLHETGLVVIALGQGLLRRGPSHAGISGCANDHYARDLLARARAGRRIVVILGTDTGSCLRGRLRLKAIPAAANPSSQDHPYIFPRRRRPCDIADNRRCAGCCRPRRGKRQRSSSDGGRFDSSRTARDQKLERYH